MSTPAERVRAYLDTLAMKYPGLEDEHFDAVALDGAFDYPTNERRELTVGDLKALVDLAEQVEAAAGRYEYAIRRNSGYIVPLGISSEERVRSYARVWEHKTSEVVRRRVTEIVGPWEGAPERLGVGHVLTEGHDPKTCEACS